MDTQVIVVGAGPVGLMLAGELRLGGAEVVVLEELTAPTTESRASTVHARTMEIFDQRALLAELGTPANEPAGHFGGIPLDLGELPTRYPGQWKIPQARVEELLGTWAAGLGADIRRGHRVSGMTAVDDEVTVRFEGPAGPGELTSQYLVGADGEDSTVRRSAGIPLVGAEADRVLLRADVAGIRVPNRRFERLPHGLAIAARRPDGVTRVMVAAFDPSVREPAAPPSFEELYKTWEWVTGEDISGGTPIWLNAFDNASALASTYRHGRILLAGDAAHRQMPVGGQAMNLGIQDAANLGWKLAAAATGRAPTGLLDTYHDERHETGRRTLGNIATQALLLLGDARVEPLRELLGELIGYPEVRAQLAGMVSGLDVRYDRGWHPLVGARMPHLELTAASGPTSTTALLRSGRGVLLDLSAGPARHRWLREAVAGWDDRVQLVCPVASPRPTTASDLPDALLLRPDGHVAWGGLAGADPRPAMRRWFGSDHRGTKR